MTLRIYLAGPDVFLPEAAAWSARRAAICARHGLAAVSPLDALTHEPEDWLSLPEWRRIALRNEAHIRACDAVIANLTPFRGPSADVGTVYEVGYARALGRRVFGYANCAASLVDRTLQFAATHGSDGMLIEEFGLFDNLMIAGGISFSGGMLVLPEAEPADRWGDLATFERCVQLVAKALGALPVPGASAPEPPTKGRCPLDPC